METITNKILGVTRIIFFYFVSLQEKLWAVSRIEIKFLISWILQNKLLKYKGLRERLCFVFFILKKHFLTSKVILQLKQLYFFSLIPSDTPLLGKWVGGGIDLSYVVEIPMKYIIIPLKLIEIKNLKSYQQKHPTIILSSNVLILTFIRQLFFFKIFLWSIQKYLSNHYLDSGNQTMLT